MILCLAMCETLAVPESVLLSNHVFQHPDKKHNELEVVGFKHMCKRNDNVDANCSDYN